MSRQRCLKLISAASVAALLLPLVVFAQDEFGLFSTAAGRLPTGRPQPQAIVATVIQIVLGVVGVVTLIMILYGGYTWLTAAGNEEKIASAKRTIIHGAIGLAIILGSYILASFVLTNVYRSVQPAPATPAAISCSAGTLGTGTCSASFISGKCVQSPADCQASTEWCCVP